MANYKFTWSHQSLLLWDWSRNLIPTRSYIVKTSMSRKRVHLKEEIALQVPFCTCRIKLLKSKDQRSLYRIGGCTSLASGTIYFRYQSIPVYRFGFTAIIYIYIYICMYVCMYVCVCVYIYYNKYKS